MGQVVGGIVLVVFVVACVGLLGWILTNDQRRENEKRRASKALVERMRREDEERAQGPKDPGVRIKLTHSTHSDVN